MFNAFKVTFKRLLAGCGYKVVRMFPQRVGGFEFEQDLRLVVGRDDPVCLDVGANEGQTIRLLQRCFERPEIYAFEPAREVFRLLQERHDDRGVHCFNFALGNAITERELINYEDSCLSSFLDLSGDAENRFRGIRVTSRELVEEKTVDWFVQDRSLDSVSLLKIDTQGYDLNVLLGASDSLSKGLIQNVLVELNFVDMYENQCAATDIVNCLSGFDLHLVDCYEKFRQGNTMAWCTALFSKRVAKAGELATTVF